jgi:hypothetical protein
MILLIVSDTPIAGMETIDLVGEGRQAIPFFLRKDGRKVIAIERSHRQTENPVHPSVLRCQQQG